MSSQPEDVQATPGQPIVYELIPTSTHPLGPVVLTGGQFGAQGDGGRVYISCPLTFEVPPPSGTTPSNNPASCPILTWDDEQIVLKSLPLHPGSREDEHLERLFVYKDGNDKYPPSNTSVDGDADFAAWIRVISIAGEGNYPPYGR